jgi:hypothetical protein
VEFTFGWHNLATSTPSAKELDPDKQSVSQSVIFEARNFQLALKSIIRQTTSLGTSLKALFSLAHLHHLPFYPPTTNPAIEALSQGAYSFRTIANNIAYLSIFCFVLPANCARSETLSNSIQ